MIDVHAHILPGVDDGSPDLYDSLLLAEMALESGVTAIIATPHSHARRDAHEHMRRVRAAYDELCGAIAARSLPLTVLPGMELYCADDLPARLTDGTALPLNGTDRMLIEFPFDAPAAFCLRSIETVLRAGFVPVIAHPERYRCVQGLRAPDAKWRRLGCELQLSKDSVFGAYGSRAGRAAARLLRAGAYTCVGSDAHSPYARTTHMGDIRDYLADRLPAEEAALLLGGNARRNLF